MRVFVVESHTGSAETTDFCILGIFSNFSTAVEQATMYYKKTKIKVPWPPEFDDFGNLRDGQKLPLYKEVDKWQAVMYHNTKADNLNDVYIYEVDVDSGISNITLDLSDCTSIKSLVKED